MNIGKVINKLMANKGITQNELSESTGISQTSISQIVTGKTVPKAATLQTIAKALGTNTTYIQVAAIEPDDIPADQRKDFLSLFPDLSERLLK